MKERLVEDWLTRVNERRGYEVAFCQKLISSGYRIVRSGHSPTEHGKDITAVAPDGLVCSYQLKTGDLSQGDIEKHLGQINMLALARPVHPSLQEPFEYQPHFVTTGKLTPVALSLFNELNAGWEKQGLRPIKPIQGPELLADFLSLSSDFWPVAAPDIRRFRELYLVDGRGDLDLSQFAAFLIEVLRGVKSGVDLERRAAAVNLFASYMLGEFFNQKDHWSVIRGWVVCASQIAWAGLTGNHADKHWKPSFQAARDAALVALDELAREVLAEDAFKVHDRELDDLTRTRNTTALAAAVSWQLIKSMDTKEVPQAERISELAIRFVQDGRLYFWGEGAFSQFLMLVWFLERNGNALIAQSLMLGILKGVAERNQPFAENPFLDPYESPDECLAKLFKNGDSNQPDRRTSVESYCLLALIVMAVRRGLREQLSAIWKPISYVHMTVFRPESPNDGLLWRCGKGKEHNQMFAQPYRWKDLQDLAFQDDTERVPRALQDDLPFSLLYLLVYQHRILVSLMKRLDDSLSPSGLVKRPPT
jgi:hypothetical protein